MVANKGWTESDIVKCIWDSIDFGNKPDQMEANIKRQLEVSYCSILFCILKKKKKKKKKIEY